MSVSPPGESESPGRDRNGLRWNTWNLLLLVPLLMLVTPLFNIDEPRLWGFPFFYWSQLVFVLVGVGSVALVYARTKDKTPAGKATEEQTAGGQPGGDETIDGSAT